MDTPDWALGFAGGGGIWSGAPPGVPGSVPGSVAVPQSQPSALPEGMNSSEASTGGSGEGLLDCKPIEDQTPSVSCFLLSPEVAFEYNSRHSGTG